MSELKELHLNLKKEYFLEIKNGEKEFEFRKVTPYWMKRLTGKTFEKIVIKWGYPRRGDPEKTLELPWRGMEIQTITHKEFGPDPVDVFAIKVN